MDCVFGTLHEVGFDGIVTSSEFASEEHTVQSTRFMRQEIQREVDNNWVAGSREQQPAVVLTAIMATGAAASRQRDREDTMEIEIEHFVNGRRTSGRSGRFAPVYNPATGEQSGAVPLASAEEMGEAVAAAKAAFPGWAATPPLRRARVLNRFLRLLEDNADAIAAIITAEHGKVLSDAAARCSAAWRWSSSPAASRIC